MALDTVTDKSECQSCHPEYQQACTDRYRSKCGPASKNQVLRSLSPNSTTVHWIFNAKKLGTVKTTAEVTMVCHVRVSDQGQNSAIIFGGCVYK